MSREKQIEEMANAMCNNGEPNCQECANHWEFVTIPKCDLVKRAERLYNAGYRKQSEGEWVAKDNFNGRCSIATCSNCGTEKAFAILVRTETIATLYPYCQKCGAKMKGGVEQ